MSFDTISTTIRTRLNAKVTGYPINWPNVMLDPPDKAPWIQASLVFGESSSLDSCKVRTFGQLVASVFVPINTGDNLAIEIADTIAGYFRGAKIDGIEYGTPSLTIGGKFADQWWQVVVTCPWQAQETIVRSTP